MEPIEEYISQIPKDASVLDVGCFGHEGENTSQFLAKHFNHVTGVAISRKIEPYIPANYTVIFDNFYDYRFDPFDLVVLDLHIEGNLINDWCEKGLERMKKLVKPGGYLINYVMTSTDYGDPKVTPSLIQWHANLWWGKLTPQDIKKKLESLEGWELVEMKPEHRREYITWVKLKRIAG